jgi:hypothetical protein
MAIDAPRRPRFLAAVPDALRPEAARFVRARASQEPRQRSSFAETLQRLRLALPVPEAPRA